MPIAPGYFLTWHTYGTWLHGDDAGSVDRDHNRFGAARLGPDASRFVQERRALKDEPLVLSPIARMLADKVMRDHCTLRVDIGGTLCTLEPRTCRDRKPDDRTGADRQAAQGVGDAKTPFAPDRRSASGRVG